MPHVVGCGRRRGPIGDELVGDVLPHLGSSFVGDAGAQTAQ